METLWEQTWKPVKELGTDAEFKEIYKQDRAALVVGAALLMSVSAPVIVFDPNVLEGSDNHSKQAEAIMRIAALVSLCAAALGFWVGSYQFLMMNRAPIQFAYVVAREMSAAAGNAGYFLMSPLWHIRVSVISLLVAIAAALANLASSGVFKCSLLIVISTGICMQVMSMYASFAANRVINASEASTRLN